MTIKGFHLKKTFGVLGIGEGDEEEGMAWSLCDGRDYCCFFFDVIFDKLVDFLNMCFRLIGP